uniref:Uncharacterized protein n=1 Tax=Leersia perrieri TaxID=77586 RepID=A0A0D9V2K2_9ORYZ
MPSAMELIVSAIRRFFSCFSAMAVAAGVVRSAPVPIPAGSLTLGGSNDNTAKAARSAVLTSHWLAFWASTPLIFSDSDLILSAGYAGIGTVARTVTRILNAHPGPFKSISLTSYFPESERDTFAGWIRTAAAKSVNELTLHNIPWSGLYVLPSDLLRCTSLERLHVSVWKFPSTAGVLDIDNGNGDGNGVMFPHLKELVLSKSSIEEGDLENVLTRSPVLQVLVLVLSWGVPQRVHLACAALRCVMVCQSVVDVLDAVAALRLERIVLWESSGLYDSYLMRIKISRASAIKAIGYLNPTSHSLEIDGTEIKPVENPRSPNQHGDFEFWEEISSVRCVRSSIKKVVFHGFSWEDSEIEFINSIIGGLMLERMYIFQRRRYGTVSDDEINGKMSIIASMNLGLGRTDVVFSGEDKTWCYKVAADLSRVDPFDCYI